LPGIANNLAIVAYELGPLFPDNRVLGDEIIDSRLADSLENDRMMPELPQRGERSGTGDWKVTAFRIQDVSQHRKPRRRRHLKNTDQISPELRLDLISPVDVPINVKWFHATNSASGSL